MINRKLLAAIVFVVSTIAPRGATESKQPVLVLLYSRFDDHIMVGPGEDRLFRLLALVEKLRSDYPRDSVSVSCEFSGTFAHTLTATPSSKHYLERLKQLADTGTVALGYSGEHEPTYRNRPKPAVAKDQTPEQRWLAYTAAAERFLNDYKDPLTGDPDASRPGGLRAMVSVMGQPAILGFFAPDLGAEAPYFHQLRRMNITPVVPGFPDPYFTMNIHGFRGGADVIGAKAMASEPCASSEVFWDTNFLRASFTDSADIRGFRAEEGKDALEKLLKGLDRSRVRLLQIEVAGYSRYLNKWPDGTPKLYPLVWAYDHPDAPTVPTGIRAFADTGDVQAGYAAEETALRWLLGEFLPANPGSRVVGPRELMKMARTPLGSEVSVASLTAAVKQWIEKSNSGENMAPTYVKSGDDYFSSADLFQLLANSLAGVAENGKRPDKVRLTHIYGPLRLDSADETFPNTSVRAADVARAAAILAPRLNDQTWRPVPSNAVPVRVEIAGQRLIPAQFLALMAEAYLAPSSDTVIKVRYFQPATTPGYNFPRQNSGLEAGHVWTLRPAPLDLAEPRP